MFIFLMESWFRVRRFSFVFAEWVRHTLSQPRHCSTSACSTLRPGSVKGADLPGWPSVFYSSGPARLWVCVRKTDCVSITELVVCGGLCKYYSQRKRCASRPHKGDTLVQVCIWRGEAKRFIIGSNTYCTAVPVQTAQRVRHRGFGLLVQTKTVFIYLYLGAYQLDLAIKLCLLCSSSLTDCPALFSLSCLYINIPGCTFFFSIIYFFWLFHWFSL